MDELPTSDDIATILGLNDGSFKQKASRFKDCASVPRGTTLGDPSFLHLHPFIPEFTSLMDVTSLVPKLADEDRYQLLATFSHFYLPQLVQAHFLISPSTIANPWTDFLLFVSSSRVASWDRYARKPVEGGILLESLYDFYSHLLPDTAQLIQQVNSPAVRKLQYRTATVIYFLFDTAMQHSLGVPPSRTTSPSAPVLASRLVSFLREVQALGDPTLLTPSLGTVRTSCYMLADLLSGSSQKYKSNLGRMRWWSCEAKMAGIVGDCQKLEEGEEMMACGRCQSVRYCSRDHQRAHWKTHKKTCWEPIW